MREILFRGKSKARGEWYHGNLDVNIKGICIITPDDTPIGKYGQVDPETVGQFTGLTDKNGKKIFEGDILAFSDRLVYVRWHEYCGCWDCSYIKSIDGKKTSHEERNPNKWRFEAEIIGNIHDNPELLKGGDEWAKGELKC